ncbi:hypothetical protein GIB67_019680 [Kingdonia uniflora]|uniref:Cupin type-2 domain-containing protein n=1 Tax=Kingdonia uniflora TaxID=39325 RepID=A0A7J7MK37_9MAGN|nr:hypothetical protein GIB67_019680 [Kingdonia uniflora]
MAQNTQLPSKIIAGADSFGCTLKDTLVSHIRSLGIEVEDIGTDKYYSVGSEIGRRISSSPNPTDTRGLVACGTGVGVSIFANKFPGVYASTCLTVDDAVNARSINNCNVLAVSGMSTSKETGIKILETWLRTPFKSPCPASGNTSWPPELDSFLTASLPEMSKIGSSVSTETCSICSLRQDRKFTAVETMKGGSMKMIRERPMTSAIVRFKAGSVEPAHHHTFGHEVVVLNGRKRVWNLSKKERYDLGEGDLLFTAAGDVHRVKYFEDTEFFIRWDGVWDILLDEDLETAVGAVEKEESEAVVF